MTKQLHDVWPCFHYHLPMYLYWRRIWQPSPVFLPGEACGQRSLEGYSPWGRKESDMTEQLSKNFMTADSPEVGIVEAPFQFSSFKYFSYLFQLVLTFSTQWGLQIIDQLLNSKTLTSCSSIFIFTLLLCWWFHWEGEGESQIIAFLN